MYLIKCVCDRGGRRERGRLGVLEGGQVVNYLDEKLHQVRHIEREEKKRKRKREQESKPLFKDNVCDLS